MLRTVPLSIIRSFSLYTQQWYMSHRFADSLRAVWHIPLLCTVKNSWWWTQELSEACRVLFQKQIWEISASSWFYYKNLSRCTVAWTSKNVSHNVCQCISHHLHGDLLPYVFPTQKHLLLRNYFLWHSGYVVKLKDTTSLNRQTNICTLSIFIY